MTSDSLESSPPRSSYWELSQPESGICVLAINRPEQRNALNKGALQELASLLDWVQTESSLHVLIITGKGNIFSAGADIQEIKPLQAIQGRMFAQFGQTVFNKISQLSKPVIAAMQGVALGGGLELAMACHLRIAADTSQLGQPEIKLGLIPGFGGTQRLARLTGKGRAMSLCLTGQPITGKQAEQIGLVTEAVAAAEVFERALTYARQLCNGPHRAIAAILDVIEEGFETPLQTAQQLESHHFGLLCGTSDKTEGVSAFLQKRPPAFEEMSHL